MECFGSQIIDGIKERLGEVTQTTQGCLLHGALGTGSPFTVDHWKHLDGRGRLSRHTLLLNPFDKPCCYPVNEHEVRWSLSYCRCLQYTAIPPRQSPQARI